MKAFTLERKSNKKLQNQIAHMKYQETKLESLLVNANEKNIKLTNFQRVAHWLDKTILAIGRNLEVWSISWSIAQGNLRKLYTNEEEWKCFTLFDDHLSATELVLQFIKSFLKEKSFNRFL